MAATVTEAGWPRRTAGLAPCTLGIEVRDDRPGAAGEVEKGRRGWVIYFPPARHNLSRGFSREHAESAAIEEEAGRRVCACITCACVWKEKRTVRGSAYTHTHANTHTPREDGKRVPPSLLLMLAAGGIKEMM